MEPKDFMNASVESGTDEIPLCGIFVDEEGDWFYKGNKIHREDIIRLFLENLHPFDNGKLMIDWNRSRCLLEAADTPFVIARVDRRISSSLSDDVILLRLKYVPETEVLDPATLYVGKDNVLYCRVRNGRFVARFSRPAYYQLAEWIAEDAQTGAFYIELCGKQWPVAEGA